MKFRSLLLLAVIASTGQNPASAQTAENSARLAGSIMGRFDRARFLCLANGIPMANFEKVYPKLVERIAEMKSKYPDFFAFGEAEGHQTANEYLPASSSAKDRDVMCGLYRNPDAYNNLKW